MAKVAAYKENDGLRMLNYGKSVELKSLGEKSHQQVRELTLQDLMVISGELSELILLVSEKLEGTEDVSNLLGFALSNPKVFTSLCKVAGASMEVPSELLEKMSITDWLRWVTAFKEVVDWEEVKELFFHLLPRDAVGKAKSIAKTRKRA